MLVHPFKGHQDWTILSWIMWGVKMSTNPETPCISHLMGWSVGITSSLSLKYNRTKPEESYRGFWHVLTKSWHNPLHAMWNTISAHILHGWRILQVEWLHKKRSHDSQLILAQVSKQRSWFPFTWAKSICDSRLLFLSTRSNFKLHKHERVCAPKVFRDAYEGVCQGLVMIVTAQCRFF